MARSPDSAFIDLDRLLAPISREDPCGIWLRYEGTYEQIRDARREDDAGLPQGVWQSELKQANWTAVESLCATALAQRSKDLQIAAWLLEAWIQLDSFAGAARGLELMRRLSGSFWDDMYPAITDDLEARVAPLQWVNEKVSRRLRLLRLTLPQIEGVPAHSLADWEALLQSPSGDKAAQEMNMARFQQSVTLTPHMWLNSMNENVLETLRQVRAFDELLDEKAGKMSPGLIQFRSEAASVAELLEAMLDATRGQAAPPQLETTRTSVPSSLEAIAAAEFAVAETQSSMTSTARPIRTRAEAYQQLADIAAFLHETDPHSPTPYLIWKAVSWGNLHFGELLPELIQNQSELSDIIKLRHLDSPERM